MSKADDNGVGRWKRADAGALGREALAYAEDVVQDPYTRAITAAHQFMPGTNLEAWLFRILRNTFLSQYRHELHNPAVGGFDTLDPTAQGAHRRSGFAATWSSTDCG